MPKVSVIIPLYNKGKYIKRALDSVFAQTFEDYEVIVVDDGSTDDSPKIVRQYNDPRLRLIQQENAGPGAARNRGAKESDAKYVAFLDADDEWLPEYLQKSYEILQTNLECDVCVSSRFIKTGSNTVESNTLIREISGKEYSGQWQMDDSISDRELQHIIRVFHTVSVFLKRELYLELGGFSEVNNFGEDWYLWIQLFISRRIFFNDTHLVTIDAEASGICSQGLMDNPIQAYYLDANAIREKCPVEKQGLLERFFAIHALRHAHVRAGVGNFEVANYLVRNFPLMKKVDFLSYLLLRAKLLLSGISRFLRKIIRKNDLQSNIK